MLPEKFSPNQGGSGGGVLKEIKLDEDCVRTSDPGAPGGGPAPLFRAINAINVIS